MAVLRACANAIRRGFKKGLSNGVIARRVGVQSRTVADFRARRKTARTRIRAGRLKHRITNI